MGAYGGTAEASKSYFGSVPCEVIVAGDIDGDCRIDYSDFAILAAHWLECAAPQPRSHENYFPLHLKTTIYCLGTIRNRIGCCSSGRV